jgi:hypothetical protein
MRSEADRVALVVGVVVDVEVVVGSVVVAPGSVDVVVDGVRTGQLPFRGRQRSTRRSLSVRGFPWTLDVSRMTRLPGFRPRRVSRTAMSAGAAQLGASDRRRRERKFTRIHRERDDRLHGARRNIGLVRTHRHTEQAAAETAAIGVARRIPIDTLDGHTT